MPFEQLSFLMQIPGSEWGCKRDPNYQLWAKYQSAVESLSPSLSLSICPSTHLHTAMAEQDLERSKPTAPGISKDSAVNRGNIFFPCFILLFGITN